MGIQKRGNRWRIRFEANGQEYRVTTDVIRKSDAKRVEQAIISAVKFRDFSKLDDDSRAVCIKLFKNQKWPLPRTLTAPAGQDDAAEDELTLWQAVELFQNYPDVKASPNRFRHDQAMAHVVKHFGQDYPIRSIWVPQIKEYLVARQNQKAAASTINKEKAALSKMFQVLIELRKVEVNPARLVKYLSEQASRRKAYVSYKDFQRILDCCEPWFRPIAQIAYCTGMRRGEVLSLTRGSIDLDRRCITLEPRDTKEGRWKRVPIHKDLVPVFEEVLEGQAPGTDKVLLKDGEPVFHKNQVRWNWPEAVILAGIEQEPHFHDLRHTWKTNAQRSGMPEEHRMLIMGHEDQSTHGGYGLAPLFDVLRDSMDRVTWDHGDTTIQVQKKTPKPAGKPKPKSKAIRSRHEVTARPGAKGKFRLSKQTVLGFE